jgi:hypothetical protein
MSWNPFTPSFVQRVFWKIAVSSYHKGIGKTRCVLVDTKKGKPTGLPF